VAAAARPKRTGGMAASTSRAAWHRARVVCLVGSPGWWQGCRVAELLYGDADADELVVLAIDSERVPAIVRYEALEPGGEQYPHIYGVLPVSAVTEVVAVSRDVAGGLVLPG